MLLRSFTLVSSDTFRIDFIDELLNEPVIIIWCSVVWLAALGFEARVMWLEQCACLFVLCYSSWSNLALRPLGALPSASRGINAADCACHVRTGI